MLLGVFVRVHALVQRLDGEDGRWKRKHDNQRVDDDQHRAAKEKANKTRNGTHTGGESANAVHRTTDEAEGGGMKGGKR